ncbi:MAG TPA: tetratricopeptide repeat protein [Thermoanaerobaculia bacterium]|nr:tetratricopeptide repeat protein [Thermoanaerobaculia bacterium]
MAVLCQVCGAANREDDELCRRCQHKLLVVSGPYADEEVVEEDEVEGLSLDEHLLERISALEESVKRTTETVRQLLAAVHRQEQTLLVKQAGFAALRELLEAQGTVEHQAWSDLWELRMDAQLLALEKRERFAAVRERVAALHRGGQERAFAERLAEADQAFAAFEVERAIAALEQAFHLDPANYELACFLGETRFNEGDSDLALEYFRRVLETRPEHFEALVYGGVLLHEAGQVERAEELLKRAVRLFPDELLPSFSLGALHASTGNLTKAVAYLERAIEVEALPQGLYLLGNCYYEMGRTRDAVARLEQAVKADPGFEEAWSVLGLAYLDRKWRRKALDAFRQALRLNPRKLQYQDLVRSLSRGGAPALPPVAAAAQRWAGKAEEHEARGDTRRAAAAYRKALDADPDNPTLLLSLALACLPLERDQEIETLTRRVLELAPGEMVEATAYAALSEALRGQGKFREGNRLGRRLLAESPSPFTQTVACYEMAYNLAEMEEDLDEALALARRSLELAPEELKPFPLAALGWVHYKRREYDEAIEYLARSTALGPSAASLTHLGLALLASGNEEQARRVLAEARGLGARGGGLEALMMERMRDSGRLLERAARGRASGASKEEAGG